MYGDELNVISIFLNWGPKDTNIDDMSILPTSTSSIHCCCLVGVVTSIAVATVDDDDDDEDDDDND